MARKYDRIDERLLQWLRENPEGATTAAAIEALAVECGTTQRHISRRFSLLEDKGALVCKLHGTTRICSVQLERMPTALHKGGLNNKSWRTRMRAEIDDAQGVVAAPALPPSSSPSIRADNSIEFEAAGGHVERLPTSWDKPAPKRQLGPLTFLDYISELE